MNALYDLKALHPHFADRPHLVAEVDGQFRTLDYRARLEAMERDPEQLARLTIALLRHMALDPQRGTTVDDHTPFRGALIKGSNTASTDVYFALQFHRVTNFIGNFTLSAASPEMPALLKAIEENLASKMFKAAQMDRRLERTVPSHYSRFRKKAEAAYSAAYEKAEKGAPAWKAFDNEKRCSYYEANVYPVARAASTAVLTPLQDRILQRLAKVRDAAYDADFLGSYTEIRITFATRYLVPAGVTLN
jgi:hypothetical protein